MTYIESKDRRDVLAAWLDMPQNIDELSYAITKEILAFLPAEPSYADFNDIIGVLECIKLEFYHRAVATYKDEKRKINGDVGYDDLPANRRLDWTSKTT